MTSFDEYLVISTSSNSGFEFKFQNCSWTAVKTTRIQMLSINCIVSVGTRQDNLRLTADLFQTLQYLPLLTCDHNFKRNLTLNRGKK